MAIPPTIPTSFVPKQPVTATPKHRTSGANPFLALAYIITGIAVAGCLAVFLYQLYLGNVAKQKSDAVVAAQNNIDQATVTEFIRLRDRFTVAQQVLDKQVALSQFFSDLENLTIQGVRFQSLQITVADDRTATVSMTGTARSFNALAAESQSLSTDKRIKRAIFSGITVNPKDSTVNFSFIADLDPSLITRQAGAAVQPAAPSTPVVPAAAATTTAPASTTQKTGTTTP